MPYIITTYDTSRAREAGHIPPPTRRAVATPEEMREEAAGIVKGRNWRSDVSAYEAAVDAALVLIETGGTIGSLPDGTVIAVRPTDWLELAGLVGWQLDHATRQRLTGRTRRADRDAIIDAYNVNEGAGT